MDPHADTAPDPVPAADPVGGVTPDAAERAGGDTLWKMFRRLGPAGVLAVIATMMPAVGGFVLLGSLNVVGPWLQSHGVGGIAIYVAGFAIFAGLALLPTYAQAILGGWAFGAAYGIAAASGAALMGFFLASLIGYEIARAASGDRAMEIIREKPKWLAVREALVGGEKGVGFWRTLGMVTLLRLPPNSPFALTNLVMASVRVPRAAYAAGTLIGMAPRTIAAVWIASSIEGVINADAVQQSRPTWMLVVGILLMIFVIAVVGLVANRAIARVTGREPGAS
ncbi:MAG: TVP38/TMEM64 family protein [Phycisphaerales bacterium JB037]